MKNGNGNQHTRIKLLNGSSVCVCVWTHECTLKGCQKCLFMEFVSVFLRKESSSFPCVVQEEDKILHTPTFIFCLNCSQYWWTKTSLLFLCVSYEIVRNAKISMHISYLCPGTNVHAKFPSYFTLHQNVSSSSSVVASYRITSSIHWRPVQHPLNPFLVRSFVCTVRDQAHSMLNTKGKRGVFMVCICGIYTEKLREV